MKKLMIKYSQYNQWANKHMCNFVENNLSEEQRNIEMVSSFPTVKKTLFHIWDAEKIWLFRLQGNSMSFFPSKDFKGTTVEGIHALLENSKTFTDFISEKEMTWFDSKLKYQNLKGISFEDSICDIVHHVMNHSTYHRGQLITMLRQLGFTTLFATDYIAFCR